MDGKHKIFVLAPSDHSLDKTILELYGKDVILITPEEAQSKFGVLKPIYLDNNKSLKIVTKEMNIDPRGPAVGRESRRNRRKQERKK